MFLILQEIVLIVRIQHHGTHVLGGNPNTNVNFGVGTTSTGTTGTGTGATGINTGPTGPGPVAHSPLEPSVLDDIPSAVLFGNPVTDFFSAFNGSLSLTFLFMVILVSDFFELVFFALVYIYLDKVESYIPTFVTNFIRSSKFRYFIIFKVVIFAICLLNLAILVTDFYYNPLPLDLGIICDDAIKTVREIN